MEADHAPGRLGSVTRPMAGRQPVTAGQSRAAFSGLDRSHEPIVAARALLDVPAEVDLDPADLVAVEPEDLGVAKSAAVRLGGLVGDDHLVVRFEEPLNSKASVVSEFGQQRSK